MNSNVKGLNLLIEYKYLTDTTTYTDKAAKTGNTITTLKTERTCSYAYAPGLKTGASDIYGNSSALVADMTGVLSKRGTCNHNRYPKNSKYGKYANILFQGMHVKGFKAEIMKMGFYSTMVTFMIHTPKMAVKILAGH